MTMDTPLPPDVVEDDHRLDDRAHQASEALAAHRWHWTLDETNPDRVSIRAYARAVGKSDSTIGQQVRGYAEWLVRGPAHALNETIERARMGAETEAATEAVAKARGTGFTQARKSRPDEVRRVRDMARQRAEDKGTSVEEEAPKMAEAIVRAERAERKNTEERTQRVGLRFVEMEGYLGVAKRKLTDALNLAHAVPWGDEERELLRSTVANVGALLALIDTALGGTADVDWDDELAKLSEAGQ